MTQYRITPTAQRDLREILAHVADTDGVDRALLVHDKFVEAFEILASAPRAGRIREDLTRPDVRWWTVSRFVVVYAAERAPILILRVLHGARNLDGLV